MDILFCIFFYMPAFSNIVWCFVPGGSYKVLELGRSKNGYKKFKKSLNIWDRIFKLRFVSLSKHAVFYQYYFVIMTYLGYLSLIISLVIWIISLFTHNFWEMFYPFLLIKCYTFELPAAIFTIFKLKRSENGVGFDWEFYLNFDKKRHK